MTEYSYSNENTIWIVHLIYHDMLQEVVKDNSSI